MEGWKVLGERGKSMCERNRCIKSEMAEEENERMNEKWTESLIQCVVK